MEAVCLSYSPPYLPLLLTDKIAVDSRELEREPAGFILGLWPHLLPSFYLPHIPLSWDHTNVSNLFRNIYLEGDVATSFYFILR